MIAKQHIPNALTYARILVVPLVIAAWYLPAPSSYWVIFGLVLFASITDFFDGYLARKWKVESEIGRLLDPNADKLLIAVALVLLAIDGYAHHAAVCLILVRELFVSGLREFMAEKQIVIHVTFLAKCKTATQMLVVLMLFLGQAANASLFLDLDCDYTNHLGYNLVHGGLIVAQGLLWVATALTLITGWDYWRGVWSYLKR